jgi:magnesium transporter
MNTKMTENEIARAIILVLKEGNKEKFREIIRESKPFDIAVLFKDLPVKHRPLFLEYLTLEKLTDLLRHLSQDEQLHVLQTIGSTRSTDILDLMKSDDLAFLLSGLSERQINTLISEMQVDEMETIRNMMNYPPKTAGRAMTDRYVWVHHSYTVERAVKKLKSFANLAEYLNYLYVIDDDKKLIGVVSYRDLLLAELTAPIEDIMSRKLVQVDVLTKQEEVAKLIGRYDFVSMPVTNANGLLVGIITVDDVLDIVIREANEDVEMLLASGKAIDFKTKPIVAARRRLPWLILLLLIGLISGSIISRFEDTLQQVVALAFFMPMIAGMTGNTGTQSLAVVVRGLVSEDLDLKKSLKLILRELLVGIIIGVTCAILIAVIAYIWQGSFTLGLVVGSSLLVTLIIGTLAGTIIPLILYKFKVDPAIASGPLITTINDILSLLIFFGIATLFISKLM